MILAAGLGERMRPLTLTVPKPAIPVLGRPMITEVLTGLVRQGVTHAVVNVHHLPDALRGLLGDGSSLGLRALEFSVEEKILGTAGGILEASPWLTGDGTIVVRNADFLADVDLEAALRAHRTSGKPATLVLVPHRPGYSVVEVGGDGAVLSLAGQPRTDPDRVRGRFLFTGLQLIEESVIDRIPADGPSDIVRDVYRDLAAEGQLHSWVHDGFWWEFGHPAEYLTGSLELLAMSQERRRRVLAADGVHTIGDCNAALGAGVDIHAAGLTLRGGVALGFASLIAEGATLEDTIVMPESWIGPGVSLRRSIVGPGAEVPADFTARGTMICADPGGLVSLPPDTVRMDGLLLRRFENPTP